MLRHVRTHAALAAVYFASGEVLYRGDLATAYWCHTPQPDIFRHAYEPVVAAIYLLSVVVLSRGGGGNWRWQTVWGTAATLFAGLCLAFVYYLIRDALTQAPCSFWCGSVCRVEWSEYRIFLLIATAAGALSAIPIGMLSRAVFGFARRGR